MSPYCYLLITLKAIKDTIISAHRKHKQTSFG